MKQPELQGQGKLHSHTPDITPLLQLLGHFHPLSAEMEAFLRRHATALSVKKRRLLLKEGMVCEHIYFIVKGALRGYIREGQKDITTWINAENYLVSSIFSLTGQAPSIENIQALENCELLVMTAADLERFYTEVPEFNLVARKILQAYYADAERRAFIARLTKAENKYRHFLLYYQPLSNRIPLKYIASFLGMTLETLSRVRKKFSSKN
jgi:CRP-like cAMP-binding protein